MFRPPSDGDVRNGVKVGLEDDRVAEDLVSEGVDPVHHDPYVCRRHPLLISTISKIFSDFVVVDFLK